MYVCKSTDNVTTHLERESAERFRKLSLVWEVRGLELSPKSLNEF